MTAYINIGSNLGDRLSWIERAVALIIEAFPKATVRRSDIIESAPWGYDSPNRFANLGLAVYGIEGLSPHQLLAVLQSIEHRLCIHAHRTATGAYADREVDIDLISIPGCRLQTPTLQLPHPRAHLRPFVTIPLAQLQNTDNLP